MPDINSRIEAAKEEVGRRRGSGVCRGLGFLCAAAGSHYMQHRVSLVIAVAHTSLKANEWMETGEAMVQSGNLPFVYWVPVTLLFAN